MLRGSMEELRVQLVVEKSKTVPSAFPVVSANGKDQCNNGTVFTPLAPIQQPSTTTVEKCQTMSSASPVVDVNGHGQCNTDTVSIPINHTQQPSTATNTVSTPLVPVQRPSTTLVGRNQTMSSATSVADTNVYGQHNNNTVATTINLSQQPSTATTLTVQRPNIKASPPESTRTTIH